MYDCPLYCIHLENCPVPPGPLLFSVVPHFLTMHASSWPLWLISEVWRCPGGSTVSATSLPCQESRTVSASLWRTGGCTAWGNLLALDDSLLFLHQCVHLSVCFSLCVLCHCIRNRSKFWQNRPLISLENLSIKWPFHFARYLLTKWKGQLTLRFSRLLRGWLPELVACILYHNYEEIKGVTFLGWAQAGCRILCLHLADQGRRQAMLTSAESL